MWKDRQERFAARTRCKKKKNVRPFFFVKRLPHFYVNVFFFFVIFYGTFLRHRTHFFIVDKKIKLFVTQDPNLIFISFK